MAMLDLEDDRRSGEERRAEPPTPDKPKALPPWGVALLILAITLAMSSATYNFTALVAKHESLEILSKAEFESQHIYQLKNDNQINWIKEKMMEADKDRDNTLLYLRALASKNNIRVKEKE